MNGRRTRCGPEREGCRCGPHAGYQRLEIFRALVATAFSSRRIVEHMKGQRLRIDSVNANGVYQQEGALRDADVGGRAGHAHPLGPLGTDLCLGAAMFAAVAAGVYKDINEATRHMGSDIEG